MNKLWHDIRVSLGVECLRLFMKVTPNDALDHNLLREIGSQLRVWRNEMFVEMEKRKQP